MIEDFDQLKVEADLKIDKLEALNEELETKVC